MWPFDPTQWADSDGDGFGDNGSINATNPDAFPNNIAVANDTDGDGFPVISPHSTTEQMPLDFT